jgi:transcriptional regulator with XRE-family HTH domain
MHHRPKETLADRLTRAREDAGLSTAQLARRLGVKTQTLANWERGVNEPRANRLTMLAGLLNVSPLWLLDGRIGGGAATGDRDHELAGLHEQLAAARGMLASLTALVDDLEARLYRLPGSRPPPIDEDDTTG